MSHPEYDPQHPATGGQPPAPHQPPSGGPGAPGQPDSGFGPGPGYDPSWSPSMAPVPDYGQPAQADPASAYGAYGPGQSGYGQPQPGGQPAGYGYGPSGPGYGGYAPSAGDATNLDLPAYGIGPVAAVKRVLQKYARFDGRASRSEYWWWALATSLVYVVFLAILGLSGAMDQTQEPPALGVVAGILFLLVLLAVVVPSIAVTVRRLHDADFSGWLYLINLVPYLGSLVLIVFTILPSKPSGARFDRPSARGPYAG